MPQQILYRTAVVGIHVVCLFPVNGLRYGAIYRVTEVLTGDPFYYGNCIRLHDVERDEPVDDDFAGFFPWRFEVSVWPK